MTQARTPPGGGTDISVCALGTCPRRGFTLIELLVVIGLILVLAALTVLFFPSVSEQNRAAQGGVVLQGWLNVARQLAVRDQLPRGLRLFVDPSNPYVITQFQYIEQPDDYSGGLIYTADDNTDPSHRTVFFSGIDLYGGSVNPEEWTTKPGDYLEVFGAGLPHRIIGVPTATSVTLSSSILTGTVVSATVNTVSLGPTASPISGVYVGKLIIINPGSGYPWAPRTRTIIAYDGTTQTATVDSNWTTVPTSSDTFDVCYKALPWSIASPGTASYRIIRTPRVSGDQILELPDFVGVDIATNALGTLGSPPPQYNAALNQDNLLPISTDAAGNKYIDILFGPSGNVITPGVTTASINLWVRDTSATPANVWDGFWDSTAASFRSDPSIIAVYVNSGLVAAHPPYPDLNLRYKFVDDGRSSGR